MYKIIFTCDYEIFGNGEGNPYNLMVKPTDLNLKLFDKYNAKLTIMADVAEILKFKEYKDKTGIDKYFYQKIVEQLQRAVMTGHDVQLHVHSSYFNSKNNGVSWEQNFNEYNLAGLSYQRIKEIIKTGKSFLESLLKPVKPEYKCNVFRAANWSMFPSQNITHALRELDFLIDTSVFKYGKKKFQNVSFDYSSAYHNLIPWEIDFNNINKKREGTNLFECPIYCEQKNLLHFLNFNRIKNYINESFFHPLLRKNTSKKNKNENSVKNSLKFKMLSSIFKKYPWKMDYNLCSGKMLIKALKKIKNKYGIIDIDIPVVLIGHSKLFSYFNALSLSSFLKYIKQNSSIYKFDIFSSVKIFECSSLNINQKT